MNIKQQIKDFENRENIQFPLSYLLFLEDIPLGGVFNVKDSGSCFYSLSDLLERNETYEIKQYDSNYFMIGQDGDLGYFINAKDNTDERIYALDLGAIGSLPMKEISHNIQSLIVSLEQELD